MFRHCPQKKLKFQRGVLEPDFDQFTVESKNNRNLMILQMKLNNRLFDKQENQHINTFKRLQDRMTATTTNDTHSLTIVSDFAQNGME